MIGRRAELQIIVEAFAAGREGTPRAVVIRGEAGIGKTRLLQEFREVALARSEQLPVVVASGQCIDLGPIGAPFTPIRRLLHDVYSTVGDEEFRAAAGSPPVIATLATLVPELEGALQSAGSGGDYIVEAIERIIENLSERFHLVLIIEDLHWADAATLALLKMLAVTLRGRHVTLLMTYRSDDVGRGHPLRAVLAELDRSRIVAVLEIPRLTDDEVAQQVQAIASTPLTAEALEGIKARSEGVPFFVEELLDLSEQPLPDTLRDVVLARFERCSPATREIVGLVAVGGVHVSSDLLAQVHAGDAGALRDALHEAIAESVLVSDRDGYSFRHALIQEAVYEDLLPTERVEAHTVYASIMQDRIDAGDASFAAEAAEHWLAAHDIERGFDATVAARRWSTQANAPIAAAKHGERMLEIWSQVKDAAVRGGLSQAELALEISVDYEEVGERERSLRAAEAGVGFAPPEDRVLRARLLLEAGNRNRSLGRDAEAIETLLQARALLDEKGEDVERALLARIDGPLIGTDQRTWPNAMELIDRAVALAEDSGDPTALAIALDRRANVCAGFGDLRAAVDTMRRASALPANPEARMKTANNLMDLLGKVGEYDEAIEVGRRFHEETVLAGRERGHGSYIVCNLAEIEGFRGDVEAALGYGERALALVPDPLFRCIALRILAMATLWDARADESIAYGERASAPVEDDVYQDEEVAWLQFAGYSALVAAAQSGGRVADAVELARHISDLGERFAGTPYEAMPFITERLVPLAGWLIQREPEVRGVLIPALDRALARPNTGPHSAALKSLGRAFAYGGSAAWREALADTEEGRIPNRYLHLARLQLAEALIAEGEREGARALLGLVIAEAPARGASLVGNWARGVASRAGMQIDGEEAGKQESGRDGLLTPRERQVLALVAQGMTNPQIGARLYISPKTASVHVSAILTKIGAANRTEAAAIYSASLAEHPGVPSS